MSIHISYIVFLPVMGYVVSYDASYCWFQMSSKTEPKSLDNQLRSRPPHHNQTRQSLCSNLTTVISPTGCAGSNSAVETRTIVVASNACNSIEDLDLRRCTSASSTLSFVQQRANHVVRISSLWLGWRNLWLPEVILYAWVSTEMLSWRVIHRLYAFCQENCFLWLHTVIQQSEMYYWGVIILVAL